MVKLHQSNWAKPIHVEWMLQNDSGLDGGGGGGGGGRASTFCHKLPNKIELKASNAPFGLFAYPAIQQSSTELSNLFHWKITVPANWFFEYKINQIDTIEFLFTASGSIRASFLYSKIAFV